MTALNKVLNSKNVTVKVPKTPKSTVSANGNTLQFEETKKEQLINIVLNTFFMEDTFYKSGTDIYKTMVSLIQNLVSKGEIDFLFNLALYARRDIGMRTMSTVLTVNTLKIMAEAKVAYPAGTYQRISKTFIRIDDMTEIMAYALTVFGKIKKVPKVLSKAIALGLETNANAYNMGKYNRPGTVNLKFLILHSHPKPRDDEQSRVFKAILEGTLEPPKTHEVEFSVNGQADAKEKRSEFQIWKDLFDDKKLPYMATIRNLVRIVKACNAVGTQTSKDFLQAIANYVGNPEQVRKGKQFPYSYFIASKMIAREVGNVPVIQKALSSALDVAVANLPDIGGNVWVITDNSGSMRCPLHKNTQVHCHEVASLFAAIISKSVIAHGGRVCVTSFATNATHVNFMDEPSVLNRTDKLINTHVGGGTDLGRAITLKPSIGFEPDTVIVLSDMQVNQLSGSSKEFVNADCKRIAFNLSGHGSTPLHSSAGWKQLSGYSDNIFKFLEASRNVKSLKHMLSQVDFV